MAGPRIESQVSTVNLGTLALSDRDRRTIDREKTCPMLVRTFCTPGRHLSSSECSRGSFPPEELNIHTWMDATLKELGALIREMKPEARRPGTRLDFNILYPELHGRGYRNRALGEIFIGQKSPDEHKTLEDARFQIGDLLDVCIYSHPGGPLRLGGGPIRDRERDRIERVRDRNRDTNRDRENKRR